MNKQALTVSIIIPVYNEESYIGACLDAIASQTVQPLEVIVIDNNSTDRGAKIARQYPFVKLLSEPRQGQVFAQAAGFNYAKGTILGRIDADSVLPTGWVEQLIHGFQAFPKAVALTGPGQPYDVPMKKSGEAIFNFYHQFLSKLFAGHEMLWGSNCAFRATMWKKIRQEVHYRNDIWEDFDMTFHLRPFGEIKLLPTLVVSCSFRAGHKSIPHQIRYQFRCIRTYALHKSLPLTVIFFFAWSSMLLLAPLAIIDRYAWLLKQTVAKRKAVRANKHLSVS